MSTHTNWQALADLLPPPEMAGKVLTGEARAAMRAAYEQHATLRCVGDQKETPVSSALARLDGLTSKDCWGVDDQARVREVLGLLHELMPPPAPKKKAEEPKAEPPQREHGHRSSK